MRAYSMRIVHPTVFASCKVSHTNTGGGSIDEGSIDESPEGEDSEMQR
jgi:hypothetical protein